jgi:hypothetical protein
VHHLFGRHVRDSELILLVTWSRPLFLSQAIKGFLGQTYPNKELIVVVDSGASMAGLVPDGAAITDIKLEAPLTLAGVLSTPQGLQDLVEGLGFHHPGRLPRAEGGKRRSDHDTRTRFLRR